MLHAPLGGGWGAAANRGNARNDTGSKDDLDVESLLSRKCVVRGQAEAHQQVAEVIAEPRARFEALFLAYLWMTTFITVLI